MDGTPRQGDISGLLFLPPGTLYQAHPPRREAGATGQERREKDGGVKAGENRDLTITERIKQGYKMRKDLLTGPFSAAYDELGGYDCMTGGWRIKNSTGKHLFTIDVGRYDSDEEAEAVATWVIALANGRQPWRVTIDPKD